jgi:hypothetical protein
VHGPQGGRGPVFGKDQAPATSQPCRGSESPKAGNAPEFEQPAQLAAIVRADLLRWGPVVKASGFIADD